MAIKKCIICANCKCLIRGRASGKCPFCNKGFTGTEVGVPVTMKLLLEGRSPTSEEIGILKNVPFERKSISVGERNKGIWLNILGVVVPPLGILFGLWVIKTFVGPGVIVFGYGMFIASPIFAIVFISWGINILVRDPRKKNVRDAFVWIWKESYKDGLESDSNCIDTYGSVIRSVPNAISDNISTETMKEYLLKIRSVFETFFDEASEGIDTSCLCKDESVVNNWSSNWEILEDSIRLLSEKETENGVCRAVGRFIAKKILSQIEGDDIYELHVAAVSVKVGGYYIKNGDYWFSYDLMPEIVD